jgi:hypothetical protein
MTTWGATMARAHISALRYINALERQSLISHAVQGVPAACPDLSDFTRAASALLGVLTCVCRKRAGERNAAIDWVDIPCRGGARSG